MSLPALRFHNSFVDTMPADPRTDLATRQVPGALYSHVQPTPVSQPTLLAWSKDVAATLGLPTDVDDVAANADDLAAVFSGNRVLDGMQPIATRYGGHQFGNWAGQLGDGRAMSLGEVVTSTGERLELQLKGAGPTPYSRRADGRAVLRSSLREFVCSEAMHHLGIATTRALSLVGTGDDVVRDMLYDGRAAAEPGAIVCRVAPSFVRFGHFELLATDGDVELLKRLFTWTVGTHFPSLSADANDPAAVVAFFDEVARRTARIVVDWQRVGFVHGVMNTDNMSILGLTIDYGPYGFLEGYDPGWTPNTTDAGRRRYRYGNQPAVAHWNLACLAEALLPLVREPSLLGAALDRFVDDITIRHRDMQLQKLGLVWRSDDDDVLVKEALELLARVETDMTLWYRGLADVLAYDDDTLIVPSYYDPEARPAAAMDAWLEKYRARCADDGVSAQVRREQMNATNPLYVPRNWLAQEAIDAAAAGNLEVLRTWLQVLRAPYTQQAGAEHFAKRRPEWARHKVGCSQLSCSS
jgi:uncharacterized protein YdiU (UPF0061 family)